MRFTRVYLLLLSVFAQSIGMWGIAGLVQIFVSGMDA